MVVLRLSLILCLSLPSISAIDCSTNGDYYPCDLKSIFCIRQEEKAGCTEECEGDSIRNRCTEHHNEETICCCKEDFCNVKMVVKSGSEGEESQSSNVMYIVIAVVVSVVVAGVAIVLVGVCCYLRHKKFKQDEGKAAPKIENDPGIPTELEAPSERLAISYDDLTDMKIQPVLGSDEKEALIKSLQEPTDLPTFTEFSNPPRLTKLITYGTTDVITINEEFVKVDPPSAEDDRSFCISILAELINNGPREYAFDVPTLKRILRTAEAVFASEPSLVTIHLPCTIYGDIHGQYSDLHRWLNANGWPNKRRSLFLGDFVDRGSHGVEVVALMCCLKVAFPEGIFICRGNHEEECLNKTYSFYNEVRDRFKEDSDDEIYLHFKRLFGELPLAAIIGKRILGMHGGISPKLNSLQDIQDIRRPIGDFMPGTLACDLVWSDPDLEKKTAQFRPNFDREPVEGIGQLFSSRAVFETCKQLGVDMIVRGHQAPLHGYARWANGHLMTLFSAPGYKGEKEENVNMGACMEVYEDGSLVIKQIKVSEEFRWKRIVDVEKRGHSQHV